MGRFSLLVVGPWANGVATGCTVHIMCDILEKFRTPSLPSLLDVVMFLMQAIWKRKSFILKVSLPCLP